MAASKKGGGGRKTSGDKPATIASKGLRGEKLTKKEVKTLAGSVLSQDETKGKKGN